MRRDIIPLCDLDMSPMRLGELGDRPSFVMVVYACNPNLCHRIYNNSLGYRDVTPQGVSTENANRRDCPECETALYLATEDSTGLQTWKCAQQQCDYSELVDPRDRFKMSVAPVPGSDTSPPYAQLRASSILNNAKWVGAPLPWEQLAPYLMHLGQDTTQLAAIKQNVSRGMESQLVGVKQGELAVTEQQLRKAHMQRDQSQI